MAISFALPLTYGFDAIRGILLDTHTILPLNTERLILLIFMCFGITVGIQILNKVIKKLNIEPKAAAMLVDFLGTDLSKIANELDKLAIILPQGSTITPEVIEENIGFSKDFNVFELRKAIGERNVKKAYQIAQYFADNPKDNPLVLTVGQTFGFFVQLLKYHGLKDRSPKSVASALLRITQ